MLAHECLLHTHPTACMPACLLADMSASLPACLPLALPVSLPPSLPPSVPLCLCACLQDNKELYAEEAAAQREAERQRMLAIPGLIAPASLQEDMTDM